MPKSYKRYMTPPFSVIKIVKCCGVGEGEGGGALRGAKIL